MYFIAGNLGFLTAQIEKKTNDDPSQKKEYVVYLVYDTANSSGHANSVRAVHLMSHGGKRGDYGTLPAPTTHEIYDSGVNSALKRTIARLPGFPHPPHRCTSNTVPSSQDQRYRSAVPFSSRPLQGVHTTVS